MEEQRKRYLDPSLERIGENSSLEAYLERLESKLESELVALLRNLGVHSIVKTEKYILPYESYINGIFRPMVKRILEEDLHKIRFYFNQA